MNTPWGELAVRDAHVHFISHTLYAALSKLARAADAEAVGARLGWEVPQPDPVSLAERWVRELDGRSVDRACLIGSLPGEEDGIAQAVAAYPERFFGYFLLDPLQPDAGARMERAGGNPHLHCVCLFPAMHRYSVADAKVSHIFEIAEQYGLAVFIHCGALSVGFRKKLGLASPFDMRFSNPLEVHPVALRHPGVRFIIPHFGAGLFRETLMLADLCPNIFLDTSSSNRWMRYEGLELRTVFARCLEVLGASRLLFGTDSSFFPRGWQQDIFDQQAGALLQAGAGPDDARQIFGANLEAVMQVRKEKAGGDPVRP